MYEIIFDLSFRCLICGKKLSKGFYFCNDCAIKFGIADESGKFKRPLLMPDWAREMYNWVRRERRKIKKMAKTWVTLNDESVHIKSNSVITYDDMNYREEEDNDEEHTNKIDWMN